MSNDRTKTPPETPASKAAHDELPSAKLNADNIAFQEIANAMLGIEQDPPPRPRASVEVWKAQQTGDQEVPDLDIRAVASWPNFDAEVHIPRDQFIKRSAELHDRQAGMLVHALQASLPGGTFDSLVAQLLLAKASHLKVRWAEPRTEPVTPTDLRWDRPRIVVLCGSTRFREAFQRANCKETLKGNIVLSVGFELDSITPEQKLAIDDLHKRKIDLADEVFVLNVGGYVGKSTQSEIEYARLRGKPIRWLEPSQAP